MANRQIDLAALQALAEALLLEQERTAEWEKRLAKQKERQLRIEHNLLPNALRELGIDSFSLSNGWTIMIGQKIEARVTDATMPAAEEWLKENNLDGIIKHLVITQFDKDETEQAEEVMQAIKDQLGLLNLDPATYLADQKTIHYQTLAATIRAQLKKGVFFPEDPFNLYITDIAKVVKPKV